MGLSKSKPRIKQECKPNDAVDPEDSDKIKKHLTQMETSICKIINTKVLGTGFFCRIPFPNRLRFLPVLITCNHVLDEDSIAQGKEIKFTLNNDAIEKSIVINDSRKIYTSADENKDITIIELDLKKDNINFDWLLDVDKNIDKDKDLYKTKSVYIIHYELGSKAKKSLGQIISIAEDELNINHKCATEEGSSGSPIINLENYGVIGVHKHSKVYNGQKENAKNYGTLLKIPIEEFYEKYKNSKMTDNVIIPKSLSNKIVKGNFYVSNIELLKIN